MLEKDAIKKGFVDACKQVMNAGGNDREGALEKVADGYAQTVIDAIKSMKIVYKGGLANGGGAVTGTFECTIE